MSRAGTARFLFRALRARFRDQRDEIRALRESLRAGDLAVDVGANKGAYTWWMRRAVGRRGRVVAFEPQPELAAYLRDMSAAMGWDNVAVREAAASDLAGRATLRVPGEGPSPGASLEAAAVAAAGREIPCATERLDDALAGAGRAALIKVDVEGHELAVFRGAAGILARDRPVLLFECEARHLGDRAPSDVFDFLAALGYSGSFFGPGGPRPLAEFHAALHQRRGPGRFWKAPGYVNNFLFRAT
ncbi:MAG TPA: FkbM family methyltransferase [Thermoanaerobaculia bacterium]|jgi:FkbM family methyltransferase|nr:FkbM family methyltransferase [Thermoanaerobaculia bacterium]